MKEWVWVIGGGLIQLLVIQEAKRRGYKVLVSDLNPLCQGSICADEFIALDTYDARAHLEYAKQNKGRFAGILTYGADVGPTVSLVAKELGLRAASFESASACRNKGAMRTTLRAGINVWRPGYWLVDAKQKKDFRNLNAYYTWAKDTAKEWEHEAKSLGIRAYPCVLKPTDNCASRGLSIIGEASGFGPGLEIGALNSKGSKFLLIEEFVGGREFAMDFFVQEKQVSYVMGVERLFLKPGIEFACVYPVSDNLITRMLPLVWQAARALQVQGPFKVDFTLTPEDELVIGEVATRQSGGVDQYTYPWVTGADPVGVALDYSLGLDFDPHKTEITKSGYGAHLAPIYEPGKIDGYQGISEARKLPFALEVFVRELDEIKPLVDGATRPLFVAARGNSKEEAFANAGIMGSLIKPVYVREK